jgi:hypothetical protein
MGNVEMRQGTQVEKRRHFVSIFIQESSRAANARIGHDQTDIEIGRRGDQLFHEAVLAEIGNDGPERNTEVSGKAFSHFLK